MMKSGSNRLRCCFCSRQQSFTSVGATPSRRQQHEQWLYTSHVSSDLIFSSSSSSSKWIIFVKLRRQQQQLHLYQQQQQNSFHTSSNIANTTSSSYGTWRLPILDPYSSNVIDRYVPRHIIDLFYNKLQNASKPIQQSYNIDNLTSAVTLYDTIITKSSMYHNNNTRHEHLYKLLCNPCYLLLIYDHMKSNDITAFVSTTSGGRRVMRKKNPNIEVGSTSVVTLSGLHTLANELVTNQYKCKPVKEVVLNQNFIVPDTKKYLKQQQDQSDERVISSSRDKVLQKAIQMMIQPIMEYTFSEHCYGMYRPMKTCHTALHSIRSSNGIHTTWFIELSLQKQFSAIHHTIILQEIQHRIHDKQLLHVIQLLLKVGYVNPHNLLVLPIESNNDIRVNSSSSSTGRASTNHDRKSPGILCPLFANILFNRLDQWIEKKLLIQYNVPRYDTEYDPMNNNNNSVGMKKKLRIFFREEIEDPVKMQKLTKTFGTVQNLWYVRYADHMLMGVIGPKKDAVTIYKEVEDAVVREIQMQLDTDKSGIVHHEDGVIFLGYRLYSNHNYKRKVQRDICINFDVPLPLLLKIYKNKGFLQVSKKTKNIKYVGRRVDKWIYLPNDYQVVHRFNNVIAGIASYYCGTKHPRALKELWRLLRRSLALTLAHRHKRKTVNFGYEKWGRDLTVSYEIHKEGQVIKKSVSLQIPELEYGTFKSPGDKQGELAMMLQSTAPRGGALLPHALTRPPVTSVTELVCSIPSCNKTATDWYKIAIRHDIPVCTMHYKIISTGKYDGANLRTLPAYDAGNAT